MKSEPKVLYENNKDNYQAIRQILQILSLFP